MWFHVSTRDIFFEGNQELAILSEWNHLYDKLYKKDVEIGKGEFFFHCFIQCGILLSHWKQI